MELADYLRSKHSEKSVRRYLHDIKQYQTYNANHETAIHKDIMDYIGSLRRTEITSQTILTTLYSIRKYYDYLMKSGQREDHPCRFIKLRDGRQKDIQLQDLFTTAELEKLLDRKERYPRNKLKNQIIISLLIYQALSNGGITRIELSDVNLEAAEIYIRQSSTLNERTLKLRSNQIMMLYKYIHEVRLNLIKEETDILILTMRGTAEKGEGIHYLTETLRKKYPSRKLNPTTIRQSVITNLLKEGKDLRIVQAFAGHKHPSTTEKYKQTDVEELKIEVLKYHPLG